MLVHDLDLEGTRHLALGSDTELAEGQVAEEGKDRNLLVVG